MIVQIMLKDHLDKCKGLVDQMRRSYERAQRDYDQAKRVWDKHIKAAYNKDIQGGQA